MKTKSTKTACGRIKYRERGIVKQWTIGCMAFDGEDVLREHLKHWLPHAEFISGKIIPDKKKDQKL